jgi:hypothetical protein
MVQVVEHLTLEALSLTPSTAPPPKKVTIVENKAKYTRDVSLKRCKCWLWGSEGTQGPSVPERGKGTLTEPLPRGASSVQMALMYSAAEKDT